MTETEFIDWLRGFTEGVHHYNVTPKQWDHLKEKLSTVEKTPSANYENHRGFWTMDVT